MGEWIPERILFKKICTYIVYLGTVHGLLDPALLRRLMH